jgi:hypothetical protein
MNIVGVMKAKRKRWVGHVAGTGAEKCIQNSKMKFGRKITSET